MEGKLRGRKIKKINGGKKNKCMKEKKELIS